MQVILIFVEKRIKTKILDLSADLKSENVSPNWYYYVYMCIHGGILYV